MQRHRTFVERGFRRVERDFPVFVSRSRPDILDVEMRENQYKARKSERTDADPRAKLKLMSFPVRREGTLSRGCFFLRSRVRHSSSPLRRPRLLGN